MHETIVTLKSGEVIKGSMGIFRPAFNWFTLMGNDRRFSFDECKSIITSNERVSINSPIGGEEQDEMVRAKKSLDWGRERGWTETDENGKEHSYPKEKWDWEKKYEKGS